MDREKELKESREKWIAGKEKRRKEREKQAKEAAERVRGYMEEAKGGADEPREPDAIPADDAPPRPDTSAHKPVVTHVTKSYAGDKNTNEE